MFFFKQKTAYEMRISDWSSDVCSSDLEEITPEHAIRWLTANPAKAMGIADMTGTLEPGKMADVVLWNGNPFSVYAHAEKVYIDGARVYDRDDPSRQDRKSTRLNSSH